MIALLIALQFLIPKSLKIGTELLAINAMVMGCLISVASFQAKGAVLEGRRLWLSANVTF